MIDIKSKPVNTNSTGEIRLSLEEIEEVEHRHEDVGPTLHALLVREDLAALKSAPPVPARKGPRKARRVVGGADVSSEQRSAVLGAYDGRCAFCDKTSSLTLTLLVTKRSGGTPSITNTVPACPTCRKAQGKRDAIDWLDGQEKVDTASAFARINAATVRLRTSETLRRAA